MGPLNPKQARKPPPTKENFCGQPGPKPHVVYFDLGCTSNGPPEHLVQVWGLGFRAWGSRFKV